jgi:hypothetical protein
MRRDACTNKQPEDLAGSIGWIGYETLWLQVGPFSVRSIIMPVAATSVIQNAAHACFGSK